MQAALVFYLPREEAGLLTWSVILRAFELVKLVPSVQKVCRIAALNTVEAVQEQTELGRIGRSYHGKTWTHNRH